MAAGLPDEDSIRTWDEPGSAYGPSGYAWPVGEAGSAGAEAESAEDLQETSDSRVKYPFN